MDLRVRRMMQNHSSFAFAPVKLGRLNEGGALVHARDGIWGPLIFQDLFKEKH